MDYNEIVQKVLSFRDERDWKQFHNLKDLAISINIEAAELLELFQWSGKEIDCPQKHTQMKEELADIVMYAMFFSDALGVDLLEAIAEKMSTFTMFKMY